MQHIQLAARSLHRWGGVTFVALVILALGIGLSVAVFTVGDALLLRPLPVRDQAHAADKRGWSGPPPASTPPPGDKGP